MAISELRTDISNSDLYTKDPNTYSYLSGLVDVLESNYTNNVNISNQVTQQIYSIKNKYKDDIRGVNNINERKLEIEHFYILKYKKEIVLLQQIILICVIGLIGCFVYSIGLISNNMLSLYLGVVLSIGFVFVFYKLWDIYVRDNNNFDEYDYGVYGSRPVNSAIMTTDTNGTVAYDVSKLKC